MFIKILDNEPGIIYNFIIDKNLSLRLFKDKNSDKIQGYLRFFP
jgi:hypothetical protein